MKPQSRKSEFDLLHDQYRPLVMKAIGMYIKSEVTAEDVCQEVFIKAWKQISTFDVTKAKFGTWIVTIAHNTAIDHLRKEKITSGNIADNYLNDSKVENDFVAPESSDKSIDRNDLKSGISKAFSNLTPKQREIAVLYFKHGLQYKEIANVLEIPLNTTKNLIFRVREVLQTSLRYEYQLINE
jgi:RNA polymerase sigma-70 factor (ECF subfamily)